MSPSLWLIVSAAVCAPMAALVFAPLNPTVALVVGLAVGAGIVVGLVAGAPVVVVDDRMLRVGRARIDVALLGDPVAVEGEAARRARGVDLRRTAWHLVRGGIDGIVRVPVADPADPVTEWVFSTRTPERVAAAIRRAQRG